MESNSDIKQAVQTLEEISDDEEMRRLAELREKAKLDEVSWTYNAEQRGIKKGEARGRQEGEKSRECKKVLSKSRLKLPKKCLKIKWT